ncbi:MAG: alpha/beta hydrolase fold domain-containing protein, partial [Armatimonadetes bacterium]|nr:alpha/beta hydrolase fold domain-containing protein [Armatimonadota bacterium]
MDLQGHAAGELMMNVRHSLWIMIGLAMCLTSAVSAQQQPAGRLSPEARFKQLDRNGDGRLTADELPAEWFARLDTNRDGVVTLEEAKAAMAGARPAAGGAGVAAPPMQVHKNIHFAQIEDVDPILLSLDLFVPNAAKGAPVAIWVHGGAWQKGDKAQAEGTSFLNSLIREGYVVAALNYRLAPAASFPAYPEDVAAGIAWVHQHVAEYGGDPNRLVLIGHSAGAHLVALVATDETYLGKHGLTLKALSGVVPLDTEAYDLPHLSQRFGGKLPDTWGIPFGQDLAVWKQASPITHVARERGIPPMLIVYSGGMMDPQRKHNPSRATDAQAFADALEQAGVRAEVVGDPKKSHVQIIGEMGLPADTIAPAVFAFFRSCLSTAPAAPAPAATGFVPEDAHLGSADVSYIDPEILHTDGRMAFLDAQMSVWVGELDPQTGLFRSASGCDRLVDKGISKWSRYSNGPEWGLDRNGPALFYVKDDAGGRGQLWRAEPPWDKPQVMQLTRDATMHNWICEASLNPALSSTRVAVYHGNPG